MLCLVYLSNDADTPSREVKKKKKSPAQDATANRGALKNEIRPLLIHEIVEDTKFSVKYKNGAEDRTRRRHGMARSGQTTSRQDPSLRGDPVADSCRCREEEVSKDLLPRSLLKCCPHFWSFGRSCSPPRLRHCGLKDHGTFNCVPEGGREENKEKRRESPTFRKTRRNTKSALRVRVDRLVRKGGFGMYLYHRSICRFIFQCTPTSRGVNRERWRVFA